MKYFLITLFFLFSCGKNLESYSDNISFQSSRDYLIFDSLLDTIDLPMDASIGQYLSERLEVKEDGKFGLKDSTNIRSGLYYYKLASGEVSFISIPDSIVEAPTGIQNITLPRGVSKWVSIEGIELYKNDPIFSDRIKGNSILISGDDEGSLGLVSGTFNLNLGITREDVQVVIGDQLRPPEVEFSFLSQVGSTSFYKDGELVGELQNPLPSSGHTVVMASYSEENGFQNHSMGNPVDLGTFPQVVSEADNNKYITI